MVAPLAARGVTAEPRVWDDASVDWRGYELVVIRSTWDYADRRDEYLRWCASLPRVLNALPVLTANTDKIYLRELAVAGIAVVPTTWIEPRADAAAVALPDGELVVKPAVSAGALRTTRHSAGSAATARQRIDELLAEGRVVMVQPYLAAVDRHGEAGLIFFNGALSHAFRKGPLLRPDDNATSGLWAPEQITPWQPAPDELALADATLDALPWPRSELLYARIDVVRDTNNAPLVLEVELTEPSLYMRMSDGAAERFAEAISARL